MGEMTQDDPMENSSNVHMGEETLPQKQAFQWASGCCPSQRCSAAEGERGQVSARVEEESKEVQGSWRRSRNTGVAVVEWKQERTGERRAGRCREPEKVRNHRWNKQQELGELGELEEQD